MSVLLDALLLATGWLHVLLAPYSKVEESFNLHAIHDVLMYGILPNTLPRYDHVVFPGAVPRTFIGSVLLAWIAGPFIKLATALGIARTKFDLQIILRFVLASLNVLGLSLIRRAVSKRLGRTTGVFFTLLTCSQFQLPFWMGRTIPNMFGLLFANVSTYCLLSGPSQRRTIAISLLVFAAVVFRAEIALLLGPLALQMLVTGTLPFYRLLSVGVASSIVSIALTVLVDSYFWQQPLLWPEFSSIFFNVVQGKSSEWGISPPLTYFTVFLPKLLLTALPLSLVSAGIDKRMRSLLVPSMTFVALISFLGHKEWRFIVYVVPMFNIAAAQACAVMVTKGRTLFLVACGCILVNLAFTMIAAVISSTNYPGGEALQHFNALYPSSRPVHVHICNLAAQTGASLFLQSNSPPYWPGPSTASWIYNKTEGLGMNELISSESPFTHLIVEQLPLELHPAWKVVDIVRTFNSGIKSAIDIAAIVASLRKRDVSGLAEQIWNVPALLKRDALWILERT